MAPSSPERLLQASPSRWTESFSDAENLSPAPWSAMAPSAPGSTDTDAPETSKVRVWYVDDEGAKHVVEGSLYDPEMGGFTMELTHFSVYMVAEDSSAPSPEPEPSRSFETFSPSAGVYPKLTDAFPPRSNIAIVAIAVVIIVAIVAVAVIRMRKA